ncbi:ligase-associated DNA damage response endonuclease PdeM [Belliella marina]|uniref:Ligase-associated DNA damage response endonuclease PdeM n=1 Tax=Belliella marina TaxID=1644146 RepID=A0ABW4VGR5_9BACT
MPNTASAYELIVEGLGFSLFLLPQNAIYCKSMEAIFIADPHFGKAAHFRKSGVPISEYLHHDDMLKISRLISGYQPKDIYFLGDLFHSELNDSWRVLEGFIETFPKVNFHLIKGNHDILPPASYQSGNWIIHKEPLGVRGLLLSHEPLEVVPEGMTNLCGHIHPGVFLKGKGKQHTRLPCYFYSKRSIILPAFGRFTGLALMTCTKGDQAFVIVGEKVIRVN